MSVISAFFAWPDGGVWSNLLASLIWGVPAFVTHHRKLRAAHKADTVAQTQELKQHITQTLGGPQT